MTTSIKKLHLFQLLECNEKELEILIEKKKFYISETSEIWWGNSYNWNTETTC